MATVSSTSNFWIARNALEIKLNALGDKDYIQVSVAGGAVIMVYVKGYIDYDVAHNYRKWPIEAYDTFFENEKEKYVYARIPRNDNFGNTALIVYASENLDLEGSKVSGENGNKDVDSGNTDESIDNRFYYIYLGKITSSVGGSTRRWDPCLINEGRLSTDEQIREEAEVSVEKYFHLDETKKYLLSKFPFLELIVKKLKLGRENKEINDVKRSFDNDDNVPVADTNVPTSKYVNTNFISKVHDDVAQGKITFEQLTKFGEFIDSMIAGKGTGITNDGRIQTDRLEVRGSMTVMDLIINEIHAMAGEWNFSDCGKIEKVEVINEEKHTYKLWMEKKTETDITNFEEKDVLLSIFNNLREGGTSYYSSWFRPTSKNVEENSITVVLYDDEHVPGGKNFAPVAGYNVTRRGNASVPNEGETNERAQSWMLSSREGRIMFLANVFKPIIEEYNYAVSIGKLPDVKALRNLDKVGDYGVYAKTIACEHLYEIDWNGDVIPRKVDRGEWSEAVAISDKPYRYQSHDKIYPDGKHHYTELEQHTVYHYGCKWGCIVDKTTKEPEWNSSDWVMLEGDPHYHLDFDSSNGWQFFIGKVNTIISAKVTYANKDITNILMANPATDVEWLRDTGDPVTDAVWKPEMADDKANVIHLTDRDMGAGWGTYYREVSFTCRIFIPVGNEPKKIENSINIKI